MSSALCVMRHHGIHGRYVSQGCSAYGNIADLQLVCRFGQQIKGNTSLAGRAWEAKKDDIQLKVSKIVCYWMLLLLKRICCLSALHLIGLMKVDIEDCVLQGKKFASNVMGSFTRAEEKWRQSLQSKEPSTK